MLPTGRLDGQNDRNFEICPERFREEVNKFVKP